MQHYLLAASGCCSGGIRGSGGSGSGSGSRLPDNEQREKETLIKNGCSLRIFFAILYYMRFSSFYSGCNFLQGPDRLSEQGAEPKVGARALNDVIPAVARCDPPAKTKFFSLSPKTTRTVHYKCQGRSKINCFFRQNFLIRAKTKSMLD